MGPPKEDAETLPLLGSKGTPSVQAGHLHDHVVYGRRWGILSIVALLQLSNAMGWVTYAPVAQVAAAAYDTTCDVIDGLSLTYMVVTIPGTFVSAWVYKEHGLRTGLVVAAVLNAVGAAVRLTGDLLGQSPFERLVWQFVGQCLCAAAQPFALGCTTLLAQVWFGEEERAIANSLSSLANPIGIAVGSVVVPMATTRPDQMWLALVATLAPSVLTLVVTVFGMQARPPTPPSTSAEDSVHGTDSFSHGLLGLATSKEYWLLFFAFGVGVGIFNAVATLMSQILVGQGYTAGAAGINSAVLIGAGIFGAAGAGALLDHTKWFLAILKGCFSFATASFAIFALFQQPNQIEVIYGVTAVMGFFCFGLLPVALELAVEITYPISEATSSGFLWVSGNIFGIAFTLAMSALKGKWVLHKPDPKVIGNSTLGCAGHGPPQTMEASCWFMTGAAVLATSISFALYTRYKRHEIETEAAREDADALASAAAKDVTTTDA